MPSTPTPWKVYRQALDPLKYGDALWEPRPIYSYRRVGLGDVGYIRRGRFHLLFSAGSPLGSRVLGTNVPSTFEPLEVGPIISDNDRPPGYLRTNTVKQVGVDAGGSLAVSCPVGPGVKMTFELTSKQGAALVTNHLTYREDVEREHSFEIYIKKHYESWVDFAREQGHGGDIKPVLVTGVDLTKEFAAIAYSDNQTRMECEFSVGTPTITSATLSTWGSWTTPGLVHSNCGPIQGRNSQGNHGTDEISVSGSVIPEDHNQCVFIRYYAIRKRIFVPLLLKAGAGPHLLPKGNTEKYDEETAVVEISDDDDDFAEIGYPETSPNVIHNVPLVSLGLELHPHSPPLMKPTKDVRDGFDVVAEFIFQKSNATSVLLHHRDVQNLLQGSEEETVRLLEESAIAERVEIDENGFGQLVSTSPSTDKLSNLFKEDLNITDDAHVQEQLALASKASKELLNPTSKTSCTSLSMPIMLPEISPRPFIVDDNGNHDAPTPEGVPPDPNAATSPIVSVWRRLDQLNPESQEYCLILRSLVKNEADIKATTSLEGEDAAVVLDILAKALECGRDSGHFPSHILRVLRSLAYKSSQVPSRYKINQSLDFDFDKVPFASGGFSDIRKGTLGGQLVAVKILRMAQDNNKVELQKHFCKETVIWKNISHPNILQLIAVDINTSTGQCFMVSELMLNGNIFNFIQQNSVNRLRLLADVAGGLQYLHDRGIIHGDIKGSNILITNATPPRACLSDFGFSAPAQTNFLPISTRGMNIGGGTLPYMAPELIYPLKFKLPSLQVSREGDIFALGMAMYEVVTGVRPFVAEGKRCDELVFVVIEGERPRKPDNLEAAGFGFGTWDLVEKCWSQDRTQRPATRDVRLRLRVAALMSSTIPPGPRILVQGARNVSTCSAASNTCPNLFKDEQVRSARTGQEGARDEAEHQYTRPIALDYPMVERSITFAKQVADEIQATVSPTVQQGFGMLERLQIPKLITDFRAKLNFRFARNTRP